MKTPKILLSKILLILFSAVVIFHFLILFGVFPYQIVWGGRINNREELLVFESVSIAINLIMIAITCISAQIVSIPAGPTVNKIGMALMSALFLLNTLGNFLSLNNFEKYFFGPLTLISSLICLAIAFGKPSGK